MGIYKLQRDTNVLLFRDWLLFSVASRFLQSQIHFVTIHIIIDDWRVTTENIDDCRQLIFVMGFEKEYVQFLDRRKLPKITRKTQVTSSQKEVGEKAPVNRHHREKSRRNKKDNPVIDFGYIGSLVKRIQKGYSARRQFM